MGARDFPYFHVEQTTRLDLSRELLLGVMSTGLRMVKLGLYDPGFEEVPALPPSLFYQCPFLLRSFLASLPVVTAWLTCVCDKGHMFVVYHISITYVCRVHWYAAVCTCSRDWYAAVCTCCVRTCWRIA